MDEEEEKDRKRKYKRNKRNQYEEKWKAEEKEKGESNWFWIFSWNFQFSHIAIHFSQLRWFSPLIPREIAPFWVIITMGLLRVLASARKLCWGFRPRLTIILLQWLMFLDDCSLSMAQSWLQHLSLSECGWTPTIRAIFSIWMPVLDFSRSSNLYSLILLLSGRIILFSFFSSRSICCVWGQEQIVVVFECLLLYWRQFHCVPQRFWRSSQAASHARQLPLFHPPLRPYEILIVYRRLGFGSRVGRGLDRPHLRKCDNLI